MAHVTQLVEGTGNSGGAVVRSVCTDCEWHSMLYHANAARGAIADGMYHFSEMNSTPEQLAAERERDAKHMATGNYADGTHRIGGFDA